jgi:hypothetical protein
MKTRKTWPVALSVVFFGSTATLVYSDDAPTAAASPTEASQTKQSADQPETRKPIKPKELSDPVKKGLAYLIGQQ